MLDALTAQEFDFLINKLKTDLLTTTNNNYNTSTTYNVIKTILILASQTNDTIQIAQDEIAIQLKVSQNRVSDYLKLAKQAGLISIKMICRCGNIRNEYTLLDNPIVNSIKSIIKKFNIKKMPQDNKDDIDRAINDTINYFKLKGYDDVTLQEVKLRIENRVKSVKGVFEYFKSTLRTVLNSTNKSSYPKHKKVSNFNNFQQRTYDFDKLEKELLDVHNSCSFETSSDFNFKEMLKDLRKK